jgi:hypothetical protein
MAVKKYHIPFTRFFTVFSAVNDMELVVIFFLTA